MAVLELSPKAKAKLPKSMKDTLLVAQDLSYARNLAANDGKVRNRSLKYLRKYLAQRSKANPLTEDSLLILWKGLFYSMWMSDKPLVQEECAENIAHLTQCLPLEEAMQFFKIGLVTLQNEWVGIDQLRLDKFMMFVRRLLRQALVALKNSNFKKHSNQLFAKILEETILSSTKPVPLGLFMHFTEIYLEELAKISDGALQSNRTIDFLQPFIEKLAFANDNRTIQWIIKFVFTHLMKQHKLGLEYDIKYQIWKEQGFVGSINQIQKVRMDPEDSDEDIAEAPKSQLNKPLDPRAGKVDVELPQIQFNCKEISEALLLPKSDPRTSKNTRNHLTIWSEKFLQLHNGVYPLGLKKLESKKRKDLDKIDTHIGRAAKRLIKFDQKLLARDNKEKKRKRDDSESEENVGLEELIVKKKQKKNVDKKIKTSVSVNDNSKLTKASKKNKSLELKQKVQKDVRINKIKKKKSHMLENGTNGIIDEYNYCFERNSGVWYVTPEVEDKNKNNQSSPQKDAEDTWEDGEYEIFVPSKKFVKKIKKTKSPEEVEQVLSNLRGKSRTSLNKLKQEVTTRKQTSSPKKVIINTKLNISQEIDDHISQVIASPQAPWDSSKKPGKPLLKTPIKPSPINPFYKLKRF
ncbi:unnamed protein product [Ceutorhynchus assimilis]|uniref:Uncharacterized protein n=1 Tax=Ceutorhynchus assimilis TaxID=467358 RepID=A0A9N9QRH5_9CUCU|nr:unnamed protein product [Ceutorhynchus assimilis]